MEKAVTSLEFCAKVRIQPRQSEGFSCLVPRSDSGSYMNWTKSVIGMVRNPGMELEISISTSKSVNGRKFLVKNVGCILNGCLQEGIITIRMNTPDADILLRNAGVKELSLLDEALRKELESRSGAENRETKGSLVPSSSATKYIEPNRQERKRSREETPMETLSGNSRVVEMNKQIRLDFTDPKTECADARIKRLLKNTGNPVLLKVKERQKYPRGTLLPSLITVSSTGIGLAKIDVRILSLQYLTTLDLSNNLIRSIEPLKSLKSKLIHLKLDGNPIENISCDFFLAPAFTSISSLSLKNIRIKVLPRSIVKLEKLFSLFVNQNNLEVLPYNMNFLFRLKTLDLQDNKLSFLPYTITSARLIKFDISKNRFGSYQLSEKDKKLQVGNGPFPTLLELAAESIKTHNRKMTTLQRYLDLIPATPDQLPATVYDFLEELKCCCGCNRMVARYSLGTTSLEINRQNISEVLTTDVSSVFAKIIVCNNCMSQRKFRFLI